MSLPAICQAQGCQYHRTKGDHYIMTKPGMPRPVVIPKKKALTEDIVLSVGRTIGLTRKDIEMLLNQRKPKTP